jgi:hypothetical protein
MTTHGQLVQFADAPALLDGLRRLRTQGYTRIDVFTPYPLDGITDPVGAHRWRIPQVMLVAGVVGGIGTLAMQYVAAVSGYPIDAGGRPDASWPAFVPAAIEVAILFAAVAGFVAFLAGAGLPTLYQPVFEVAWFEEASRDGFLFLLRADDPLWDAQDSTNDIAALRPLRHAEVAT